MTSGIAVTPEKLREISTKMNSGAADVRAILSRLADNVAPVRSEWVGTAQSQFNTLWDQLQLDASGLNSVLTGIAKLTQNAASAYEAAEQSIARAFDEFRVEKDPFALEIAESDIVAEAEGNLVEVAEVELVAIDVAEADGLIEVAGAEGGLVEVVEAEGELNRDSGGLADRPKSSMRLPWTRFISKAAHDPGTGEFMIGTRRHERRFKTSDPALKPGTRLCRLCFTVVILEPQYIETTDTHVYICCPHCSGSFPVRHSDVEALLTGEAPLS